MSLLPYVLNELTDDLYPYRSPFSSLYDQNFGLGLLNDDLILRRPSIGALSVPLRSGYLRLLRPSLLEESGVSSVSNQKDQFKVNLDVQQFKPEEINVKVVDNYVVVEGKHEEKQDKHGFISRQFTRRYRLPENVQQEKITSTISSDGILSIVAPKNVQAIENSAGREIPITHTNQPALKKSSEGQEKMES
uniref:Heat shock protein n=1 Tax=Phenacoccus solenopsis TaxID=483260 RepID=A0A097PHN4_9HEMI|nr:heat shock protein [Phenacoccus solenopsis]